MTNRSHVGRAVGLVLGVLAACAVAGPATAAWWGKDGQWHQDNRWNNNRNNGNSGNNNSQDPRYYGYHYREPPVVYGTPYNYGYVPPPVVYDNTPGFSIRIF